MFYLCFSKAFNTVSPNILLKDELSWADSEVAWKVAQVPPGRTESSWKPGISGAHQGSVLGPAPFNLR